MVLAKIFRHLTSSKTEFESDDTRISIIALSFYLINADGIENKNEYTKLINTLKNDYEVEDGELEQLLVVAEEAYKNALDISIFCDNLKIKFDESEIIGFIRFLFDLAYCNNHVSELEDNVIWRIANMLDVSDELRKQQKDDAARARHTLNKD